MINVCSNGENGGYNGLGVSRFIRFNVPAPGNYTFEASFVSGINPADPDMYLYQDGEIVGSGISAVPGSETFSANLVQDVEYILEVYEYTYANPDYAVGGTDETCFTINRTQN